MFDLVLSIKIYFYETQFLKVKLNFLSRDVQSNDQFLKLNEMINLSQMLMKTKNIYFVSNDIFVKLTLILPMTTVPIQRFIFLQ